MYDIGRCKRIKSIHVFILVPKMPARYGTHYLFFFDMLSSSSNTSTTSAGALEQTPPLKRSRDNTNPPIMSINPHPCTNTPTDVPRLDGPTAPVRRLLTFSTPPATSSVKPLHVENTAVVWTGSGATCALCCHILCDTHVCNNLDVANACRICKICVDKTAQMDELSTQCPVCHAFGDLTALTSAIYVQLPACDSIVPHADKAQQEHYRNCVKCLLSVSNDADTELSSVKNMLKQAEQKIHNLEIEVEWLQCDLQNSETIANDAVDELLQQEKQHQAEMEKVNKKHADAKYELTKCYEKLTQILKRSD